MDEEVTEMQSEVEQLKLEHAREVEDAEDSYEEDLKVSQRDAEDEVAQLEARVAQYERKLGGLLAQFEKQESSYVSNNLPALVG